MSQFNFQTQPSKASGFGVVMAISVGVNLLLVVVVAALLLRGPQSQVPVPADAASVMEQAERTRLVMEADASEELAKKVANKEIKNSNQLYQWAKAYQDKIDETAYAEINRLNQQVLVEAENGWTDSQIEAIQKFQAAKAEGKRRLAQ